MIGTNLSEECAALRERFARSFMDLAIIRMLIGEPLWGYKLMSMLKEKYNIKVGPSVMYPLLYSMQADGLIESKETLIGRRIRKAYNPTKKGFEYLRCLEALLKEFASKC